MISLGFVVVVVVVVVVQSVGGKCRRLSQEFQQFANKAAGKHLNFSLLYKNRNYIQLYFETDYQVNLKVEL